MNTQNFDKYSGGSTASSRPQVVLPSNPTDQRRPAVVRQLKNHDGSQQSLRLDASSANTVPVPHLRRHQLEEYVNWLQNQATGSTAAAQATTTDNLSPSNQRRTTDSGVTQPFSKSSERHDAAHDYSESTPSVRRPHLPAEQFSGKGDLDRILSKLDSVHFVEPGSTPATVQTRSESVNHKPTAAQLPVKLTVDDLLNSESIIRTISSAIASVLTNESELLIERKVRERLDDVLKSQSSLGHIQVSSDSLKQANSPHPLQSGDAVRIRTSHGHVAHFADDRARNEMNRLERASGGDAVEIRSSHGHIASRTQSNQSASPMFPLQSGDAVRVQSSHGHVAHYADDQARHEMNRFERASGADSVEIRSSHGHIASRTQPNQSASPTFPLQSGDAVRVQSSHGHVAHYADESARAEIHRLHQSHSGDSVEIRSSLGHVAGRNQPNTASVEIAPSSTSQPSSPISAAASHVPRSSTPISKPLVETAPPQTSQAKTKLASSHAPTVSMPPTSNVPVAEIPTNVAAWDVEEFRWPKLTNHMLDAGAEAIDELAKSVLRTMIKGHQRLAVTSPGRGEGTSSIAISLARCVAKNGGRVLLVDADLSHPGLSNDVGLGPNISWSYAIRNGLPSSEVIIRSQQSQLCVMPLAPLSPHLEWPQKLLDQLGDLIAEVQSSFDLVIYDCGPAKQLITELSASHKLIDVGLIVHNGLDRSRFQETQNQLQKFGVKALVVAQNAVHQTAAKVA